MTVQTDADDPGYLCGPTKGRLTNEGSARRIVIRARARELTHRPNVELQFVPQRIANHARENGNHSAMTTACLPAWLNAEKRRIQPPPSVTAQRASRVRCAGLRPPLTPGCRIGKGVRNMNGY
jgi:hypothetical protein